MKRKRAATLLCLFLLLAAAAAVAGLSDAQRRGKRIYLEGKGRHKISAFLLSAGIRAPGPGFPCINCHLAGGTGQLEGGVQSADITWFHLTKEFSGKRPSGRTHPPYDAQSLMTAITSGLDPAGNELDKAHPRFEMEREDLEDLVAYLQVMEREPVPGVTDNTVRVGILLPDGGPLAEAGREVEALLSGYFAEVNARGGLYGRSLVLVPLRYDPRRPDGPLEAAQDAVGGEKVFCFLANLGVGADDETARYLAGRRVPVVVPLLSAPDSGYGAGRYVFHIFASIRDQAKVVIDFLAERLQKPDRRVGILHAEDSPGRAGAEGAKEQIRKHGLALVAEESFSPGTFSAADAVKRLRGESVEAVLYFGGPREAIDFVREEERQEWRPLFIAPATMAGSALTSIPSELLGSVYLVSPFDDPDPSSRKVEEFIRLGEKHGVGRKHHTFQYLAYSGSILLEEGLKRSGRSLTREKFVDSIGNVWKLETGVTPPLTYSPNRRAGAVGASILKVDPATRRLLPEVSWREPK